MERAEKRYTETIIPIKRLSSALILLFFAGMSLISACASTPKAKLVINTIEISLITSPEGAEVLLDGEGKGFTPYTLQYAYVHEETKQRILTIRKDGYVPYVFTFSMKGKEYEDIPALILLREIGENPETMSEENNEREEPAQKEIKVNESTDTEEALTAEDWFEKGIAFSKDSKYEEEIEAYKHALEIKPDYADAHFNLALCYLQLNDIDSAYEAYEKLKTIDSGKAKILYEKAILRASLNRYDKIIQEEPSPNREEVTDILNDHDEMGSPTIFTIQTGTFDHIERAINHFESLLTELAEHRIEYLRVEKSEDFFVVRLGQFENHADAKQFLLIIESHIPDAIVLQAYLKYDRIIKLVPGSSLR